MFVDLRGLLESTSIEASAPCRIDMGGTLDIATFYYPLRHLNPCTLNMALALRTRVRLLPNDTDDIRITSAGFPETSFAADEAPFNHPLGLMFAIAAYFNVRGVHIDIDSASPPRSGLGGSSAAAVALLGAFSNAFFKIGAHRQLYRREIAILAHALEESVAGVPCGLQDQLAAAYGGVNVWHWHGRVKEAVFEKEVLFKKRAFPALQPHLLLAYCGEPHESGNINGVWVGEFLSGKHRTAWKEIIACTHRMIAALSKGDYAEAAGAMNRETAIREEMTPDVLTAAGKTLVQAAVAHGCGARFTGAGGGGCIWAMGDSRHIDTLRDVWKKILSDVDGGRMLNVAIDAEGLAYAYHGPTTTDSR